MKKITFDKFLNSLEEEEREIPGTIHICPPVEVEFGNAESDQDSDKSDNEVEGNHLPGRILLTDVLLEEDDSISVEPAKSTKTKIYKKKKSELVWKIEVSTNLRRKI